MGNAPTRLSKATKARIEDWSDERQIGNSLIVTLMPGLAFEDNNKPGACHVYGFDAAREAVIAINAAASCACADCAAAIARATGKED